MQHGGGHSWHSRVVVELWRWFQSRRMAAGKRRRCDMEEVKTIGVCEVEKACWEVDNMARRLEEVVDLNPGERSVMALWNEYVGRWQVRGVRGDVQ